MLTLAAEVLYYKKKVNRGKDNPPKRGSGRQKVKPMLDSITIGTKFKPITDKKYPREIEISSIYPKSRLPYVN